MQLTQLLFTALTSFIVSLLLGPSVIKILHRLKFGQSIREDGPQSHLKKAGTPTMGGVLIIISLLAGLMVTRQFTPAVLWTLFLTLGAGLVGFVDDMIIIITKKSLGLKARQKLFAQIAVASIAVFFMLQSDFPTAQLVPFIGRQLVFPDTLFGNLIFFGFAVFVIISESNAVNLTDGLDGLAGGTTAIAAFGFGVLALLLGHHDLAIFAMALVGACVGFVWFNGPPAQVFMGDTGSLALGAALAGLALFSQTTLFLLIIGGVFLAETLSVVIQVFSY
ncbi:MAG TPA: phospho-N-acetylmuramoyl-pentapeptide-transferase, partial [Bacillota bacterium]|nr:phospho-N-acetylmuramoyl-pentapeptide-transferase [Bacillota bacterium]